MNANRPDLTPTEFALLQSEGADMETAARPEPPKPEVGGMTAAEYAIWQDEQAQTKMVDSASVRGKAQGDREGGPIVASADNPTGRRK